MGTSQPVKTLYLFSRSEFIAPVTLARQGRTEPQKERFFKTLRRLSECLIEIPCTLR